MCTHDLQRFCCTLSLCTYPGDPARPKPIKSVFDDHVTASELFNSVQHIYKDWDYRCLVPYSHKNPTKWKTYEMHDYRKASSGRKNWKRWIDSSMTTIFSIGGIQRCWSTLQKILKVWKKPGRRPMDFLMSVSSLGLAKTLLHRTLQNVLKSVHFT